MVMPVWSIVVDGHFHPEGHSSLEHGLVISRPDLPDQIQILPWKESEGMIRNFGCSVLHSVKKDHPIASVIGSRYRAKVLDFSRKIDCLSIGVRPVKDLWSLRPEREIFNGHSVNADIGSIRPIEGSLVDAVGVVEEKGVDDQSNQSKQGYEASDAGNPIERLVCPELSSGHIELVLLVSLLLGISCFVIGCRLNSYGIDHSVALAFTGWWIIVLGTMLALGPLCVFIAQWITSTVDGNNVPQQSCLTSVNYRGTLIAIGDRPMANVLNADKQTAIIGMLAEGSGIRSIERQTGVHRDTIMRLGVRIGQGCANLMDRKMRDLPCKQLQFDEIWGFIGKQDATRHGPTYGQADFAAFSRASLNRKGAQTT
jgi:hypothetical protein